MKKDGKKYLLSVFKSDEIKEVYEFFDKWNLKKLQDIEINLEAYKKFKTSTVDILYMFGNMIESEEEFGGILSIDLFMTKNGLYYYDYNSSIFERIENNSKIYFLRMKGYEITTVSYMKLYLKAKFNIELISAYSLYDHVQFKKFGLYYSYLAGVEDHFPEAIFPINKRFDRDLYADFLCEYLAEDKRIIMKQIATFGGKDVFICDLGNKKGKTEFVEKVNNILDKVELRGFFVMKFIDTSDDEIRILWRKNKDQIVDIIFMYKKVRQEGQILHNISQGNKIEEVKDNDIGNDMIESIKKLCSKLNHRHGGLDVMIASDGNFYFTENNILTGYLDSGIKYPYLKKWLDAVSENYL